MNLCKGFVMTQENLFDLIKQATAMLMDRPKPEQDLIYYICKLEPDLRAAIILAYRGLYDENYK